MTGGPRPTGAKRHNPAALVTSTPRRHWLALQPPNSTNGTAVFQLLKAGTEAAVQLGRGRAENAEACARRCDCDPASGKEGGLASSIHLAAGQFAARARYGAPRWFGETLDGIRMTLG